VIVAAVTVAIVCCVSVFAPPKRYGVDGLSMAPGLLPDDLVETGWFPSRDRLRQPRRHERWILALPDGTSAIKRVVGLPGETVSIRHGDLAIGGQTVLTPPSVLAEMASPVPEATICSTNDADADRRWHRTVSMLSVLDDAAFAPSERRLLVPVRDVGLTAVIRLPTTPSPKEPIHVRIGVGGFVIPWRLTASGRYAVVAGRLDGHVVGVAWPIAGDNGQREESRSMLPSQPPSAWDVARPWMPSTADADDTDGPLPTLSLGMTAAGVPVDRGAADAMIERVAVWRDILHRPAADGVMEWSLGPDAFLVLGDFPSGSRDSRHWGTLGRDAFLHRAVP
jgi:type IV secretory pathway protease TraF